MSYQSNYNKNIMVQGKRETLFEKLYQDYHEMVMSMCMGYLKGNTQLANDLSQEVFMGIWQALDRFRSDSSIKTWVYRITVNTCLLHIRNNKNKKTVELSGNHNIPEEKKTDFSELYDAIGKLAEVDRIIIMLVLDEVEYEDISEIIGVKEGNLRVRIHRIKKKLNELLQNHGR